MVNKWIFFLLVITNQEFKLHTHDAYNQLLGTQIKVIKEWKGEVKRLVIPEFVINLIFFKT